jgi:hypothetical protein
MTDWLTGRPVNELNGANLVTTKISGALVAQLLDYSYTALENRRRRARAAFLSIAVGVSDENWRYTLPVDDPSPRGHYSVADVVRIAVAVHLERMGVGFTTGAKLAVDAECESVIAYTGPDDLYAYFQSTPDGTTTLCTADPAHVPVAAVSINLSRLWRSLNERAERMGIPLEAA